MVHPNRDVSAYIIVVGEDVDVTNMEEVIWALTTRMNPERDIHVRKGTRNSATLSLSFI